MMKKEDLIKEYEEIPFSGQLEERVYKTLESQKKSHVRIRRWKTAIATLLVCVLAVTACTAAAIHYDWFAELYPETAGIVEDNINRPSNSVENDHLRMSGESSVFTGNAAILFLKIEALDKEGKEWMRLASRGQLSLDLELCGPEGKTGAAGSTKLLEQYSDGDTWYYQLIHMEGKADRGTPYEKAIVRFWTMENEKNDVEDQEDLLTLEIEIENSIKQVKTYEQCEGFAELSINPVGVTCIYQRDGASKEVDIRIHMKDGKERNFSTLLGAGENEGDYMEMSEDDGTCYIGIWVDEFIDLDQIESVTLNGKTCF